MLALEDDRISPRLKQQIERILEISVSDAVAAARRKLAQSDRQRTLARRKAARQALAAQREEERRGKISALLARRAALVAQQAPAPQPEAAPARTAPAEQHDGSLPIVRAAQAAGVTPAEIAAHKGASERFILDVFAGRRKALPWMFEAIAAAAAQQAPPEQAEAAD